MPRFCIAERERGMKLKKVILADPSEKGAKTGVLSDQTGNISKNMAFLQRYGCRPKTILGQRMASRRPIMRLNHDERDLSVESSG